MGRLFDLRLLELADGGTLRLAWFASDSVVALWRKRAGGGSTRPGNKGRAACQTGRVTFRKYQSLDYYLGTYLSDPAIDIGLSSVLAHLLSSTG